jgi:hypothetical protein
MFSCKKKAILPSLMEIVAVKKMIQTMKMLRPVRIRMLLILVINDSLCSDDKNYISGDAPMIAVLKG